MTEKQIEIINNLMCKLIGLDFHNLIIFKSFALCEFKRHNFDFLIRNPNKSVNIQLVNFILLSFHPHIIHLNQPFYIVRAFL